ncbi:MAG: carbohydrate kinase [Desulfobacteraceae bacterium]|nr:carbohydrate kinase [Desulfobacteraceae bacterium]
MQSKRRTVGSGSTPSSCACKWLVSKQTILAIDCGTQSLRAILFSPKGELLERVQVSYEPYFSHQPGWAEQDPKVYWTSLCTACLQLKKAAPEEFNAVAGVGVATQRATMINVDQDGNPLRPAITWLDQRKATPFFGCKGLLNLGLKALNLEQKILIAQAEGKCNWIKEFQPEIWEKTHKYLQVSGFLNHQLTGNFSDSIASQIAHLPFSYRRQAWSKRYELLANLFPIEKEKLITLVPAGEALGAVTSKASDATGIPKGVPVIACASDKGCETIGAGVTDQRMISLSFGTTATVQTTSQKYFEAIKLMPAYPSPVAGAYNSEVEIFRGFWMITWFKNEFAQKEVEQAKAMGISAEEVLNQCLEKTDPGAMGLIVQPYWGPGLDRPLAKGAMIGFGDVHTKAHIYRAVIEGLGFALKEGMERIEKKGKVTVEKASVSGGASQSDEICRIMADIFNLPMIKGRTHETSGLGAAIITAAGIGVHSSLDEAVKNMMTVQKVFEPDHKNVSIYQDLYQRVYKKMYQALEPLYLEIKDITGYPEK